MKQYIPVSKKILGIILLVWCGLMILAFLFTEFGIFHTISNVFGIILGETTDLFKIGASLGNLVANLLWFLFAVQLYRWGIKLVRRD